MASLHFKWRFCALSSTLSIVQEIKSIVRIIYLNFKTLRLFSIMEHLYDNFMTQMLAEIRFKYISYCVRLSTSIERQKSCKMIYMDACK